VPEASTTNGSGLSGAAPVGATRPSGGQRQERATATPGGDDERVTLTRAQLAELVNAESNRREAKRQATEERERRRRLRDADPISYADEDRDREAIEDAQSAQREQLGQQVAYYDQHTLVPYLNSLPPDVVGQLRKEFGGGVEGLEGRAQLMARGRELLEARIRADERDKTAQRLRANPALLKQRLLEEAEADVAPPPEVSGGVAPLGSQGLDMNTQLRALLAAGRGKR